MKPLQALVTGGGGFLGSRIIALLLDEGWSVRSFSRKSYSDLLDRGVGCYTGDLADEAAVSEAVNGCDVVFHAGAKLGIWGDYAEYHAVNVIGTHNVIEACRRHGVHKLIFTSSPSAIFRGRDLRNASEATPVPTQHLCHYAATKALAERLVIAANGPDLAAVVLRPHLIWGPGDPTFLPRLRELYLARRPMLVGKGDNIVDPVFVDTAARAHVEAAKRIYPGSPVAGRVYFLSQGDPQPMRSFLNHLLQAEGLPPVQKSIPFPVAYLAGWALELIYGAWGIESEPPVTRFAACMMARSSTFDITAARRDLGYQPETFAECLRRIPRRARVY